jgi:AAA+ ATPase superfamily predicted ATPase
MKFLDRTREPAGLDAWHSRREGTINVVYGRRRIGKTALLER